MPIEESTFEPAKSSAKLFPKSISKLLANPHWQSMWPTFIMRKKPDLQTTCERVELKDGDFIDLEFYGHNNGPIVILLHGVTGHVTSPYIKYIMPILVEKGWHPVLMYYRGYGVDHNRLDVMTHAGQTGDFDEVVEKISSRYPNTPIAAIGFSQGANLLLKYLGEKGINTPLSCAIAVSPPFQLRSIANRIRHGMSRFYQWYLLRQLKEFYRTKFRYRRAPFNIKKLHRYRSFWRFDDKVTAPVHNFNGAVDYYRKASCAKYLPNIKIKTLIIHAKDDPIMTPDIIPTENEISPSTTLELSSHGGHLGFVSGTLRKPVFWLSTRIPEFLTKYL